MDVLGLEFLSWKMTRSVSFESEKCISQQKYTREHVERKRLMIPLAWLKLAIRLLIIFFFSLSFLFFSFSLYSWQSIIICKKSSLLYNLLNQVSWDQINLSISTRFYSGLKILKKTWAVIEEFDLGHVTDKSWRSLFVFLLKAYTLYTVTIEKHIHGHYYMYM